MALAKKCDVCGSFYDYYNGIVYEEDNGNTYSYNGIRLGYYDKNNTLCGHFNTMDLCPKCMESILKHIDKLKIHKL